MLTDRPGSVVFRLTHFNLLTLQHAQPPSSSDRLPSRLACVHLASKHRGGIGIARAIPGEPFNLMRALVHILAQRLLLALPVLLAGCVSPPLRPVDASAAPAFPDRTLASQREGIRPGSHELSRMGLGMSKDQVRDVIGSPHFREGLFGVREWNYIFQFQDKPGQAPVICQYLLRFDRAERVEAIFWEPAACQARAEAKRPVEQAGAVRVRSLTPATAVLLPPQVLRFEGAQLFATADAVRPSAHGHYLLQLLAQQLRLHFHRVRSITIAVATPGPEARARAESIVAALQAEGAKSDRWTIVPAATLPRCAQPLALPRMPECPATPDAIVLSVEGEL